VPVLSWNQYTASFTLGKIIGSYFLGHELLGVGEVLRFELEAFCLPGKQSSTLATLPVLFSFSYFSGRVLSFCLGLA
jgi:hypothetical protein